MPQPPKDRRDFTALVQIVEALRGPNGCPWDKEQTHKTLTRYALEEAAELAEAIDQGRDAEICEELGDLLLQVVLNAEIARQDQRFDIHDVIQSISDKMVRRHPHVFADVNVKDSSEVLKNWAEIKKQEKATAASAPTTGFFNVPVAMPQLLRAQKIGQKTKKMNFDWKNAADCWPKIREELTELEQAMASGVREEIESELGDVLFSVAQLARHLDLDSESALRQCNHRFEARFAKMYDLITADSLSWETLSDSQKEIYWKRAKEK